MESSSADESASTARSGAGVEDVPVGPPAAVDVRILQDPKRFQEMTLGDPYVGKYKFLDVAQGEAEIKQLIHLQGRNEVLAREYEDVLVGVEKEVKTLEKEYADLQEALEVKAKSLQAVQDKAERIKGKLYARRKYFEDYGDAIEQARKGLEDVRNTEVARQQARGN